MKTPRTQTKQAGFTLLELMVSIAIFVVLTGAMFGLLDLSQKRSQTESQVLASFQEARLGLDQIVRDVSGAGYPPLNHFSVAPPANLYAVSPVAWNPSYPATPCQIGTAGGAPRRVDVDLKATAYTVPAAHRLGLQVTSSSVPRLERSPDPAVQQVLHDANDGVEWVRYQLQGTTLFRGVASKVAGADPVATMNAPNVMVPYVLNVMNNAPAAQIAQFQASYPAVFPGGNPQPIFQFTCDAAAGPKLCQNAGASNSPVNVRSIDIRLIVMAPQPDAQTRAPRLVELNGRGRRINPNR